MIIRDMIIIGGGCAGMAAALGAKEAGLKDIVIIERDKDLGGILQQCIHNGFGLQIFREELSGPSYAERYKEQIKEHGIAVLLNTTVVSVSSDCVVTYVNAQEGYMQVKAKAIVFACGCYERSRGAISIPGDRGKGIYTAGSAQRYLNMDNVRIGNRVFILGSGDIGLIMARRMTLEGAKVLGVAELLPYSNGLKRNIVQCLEDFDIPLYLSHTVTNIRGKDTLEQITIMQVDEKKQPISGSEKVFDVDTLLLSVGLIPETQLERDLHIVLDPRTKGACVDEYYQTSMPHMFACGNALHVHDLADFVCVEARRCGSYAAQDVLGMLHAGVEMLRMEAGEDIAYVLPQHIHAKSNCDIEICYRVKRPIALGEIELYGDGRLIKRIKKQHLLPAEMGKCRVEANELAGLCKGLKLKVREF